MRFILSSLLFFFCSFAFGQQLIPIQYDTTLYDQELIVSGLGEYGSTSIQNVFSQKLILGGYLSEYVKSAAMDKHKKANRLGVDLNSDVEYRNMKVNVFGKENLGFVVKGGSYVFGSGAYSKDAFGLVFNGNTDFIGSSANFSELSGYFMSFQKIGFGIIDKKTKSSVSLNFFNVSNYQRIEVKDGLLTENTDGTAITLELKGQYNNAVGNGLGVGIDIDYKIPFLTSRNKKSALQFVAKNLGIVGYKEGIHSYYVDSTYDYSGFQLNQVYGDHSIFTKNIDLLDTLGVEEYTIKRFQFTPGYVQVGKIVTDNSPEKWQTFFGVRLYPSLSYNPFLYFGVNYKASEKLETGSQVSYGGFSSFKFGYYINYKVKAWNLGIATQDIYGTFFKLGYGKSLLIRVRCRF